MKAFKHLDFRSDPFFITFDLQHWSSHLPSSSRSPAQSLKSLNEYNQYTLLVLDEFQMAIFVIVIHKFNGTAYRIY